MGPSQDCAARGPSLAPHMMRHHCLLGCVWSVIFRDTSLNAVGGKTTMSLSRHVPGFQGDPGPAGTWASRPPACQQMRFTQEEGLGRWQGKQAVGPCITPGHKQAKFYQLVEVNSQVHNWGGERGNCFRKNWVEVQRIEAPTGASNTCNPFISFYLAV